MMNTILEMQKSLQDGCFVAFVYANEDQYVTLTKSDDIGFINERTMEIHRKSGFDSIINLNLIVEICIKRGMM
ncbi:hypothetical protein [Methanobrevibacter sp.]|uniref:hypothetical protein n=1 Tax=Methanobrevibacter sp. TaxID=66852 RepID=UPI00386FC641